jgi:hypothetical protein
LFSEGKGNIGGGASGLFRRRGSGPSVAGSFAEGGNVMPLLRFLSETLTFVFLISMLYMWAAFGPALRF